MRETLEKLHRVAETDSLVLLLGESGSGKDYYARYLHDSSTRKGGPFYSINLAALPPELAESELFGHERGAFTGSRGRKRGLLELAEGGTLLMNEIGEIQVQLQAKLLRFLDTRSFTRVGGEKDISVDARLIAATNKDLKEEVEAGNFRKDLFYRLSVFVVRIPPLRERREDLPFMAGNIIESLANRMGLTPIPTIDTAAMEILADYEWPGNVRELRNVLERSLIISRKTRITEEDVRVALGPSEKMSEGAFTVGLTVSEQSPMDEAFRSATRFLVSEALDRSAGNVSAAARLLGISRDKLRHQMKALGIRRS
jgi:DNA-binding NtrC family response regulator